MKNKRAVIVQCRLSSTRLPGKALKVLGGKTVLSWVLNSMKKVDADRYFVATDFESYDTLAPICKENGFECFAGELDDVLKRFCDLIKKIKVSTIIRATADNPFLFYEAAQASLEEFEQHRKQKKSCAYLTFTGLPHGSGVEIIDAASLLEAAEQTDNPYDHEHVGPALYNHKENFTCEFVKAPSRFYNPELRTTIDTYSDYLRAVSIVNYLGAPNQSRKKWTPYTTEQILDACKSEFVQNPIVYVPSVTKGQGTGHLHRCLASAIATKGFVYIPKDSTLTEIDQLVNEYLQKGLDKNQLIDELPDQTFEPVIVTDCFKMSEKEAKAFYKCKKLISIDEGSDYTQNCDYLLDIIPSYDCERLPNTFDTSYIEKPVNKRNTKSLNIDKVLVCIGGEDPAGLTVPAVRSLAKVLPGAQITAIVSNLEKYRDMIQINFIGPVKNLREKIHEYDLVVTHYGLTAFEAAFAGCAVIMLATTKLHEKLAQKYDFACIPQGKIDSVKMQQALESPKLHPSLELSLEQKSLSDCIKKLSLGTRLLCPVCRTLPANPDPIISRNAGRTYRRCRSCGIVYMSFSAEEEKEYKKSYFFEDYKKQYGKTYQEDFDSIKKQCVRRIQNIKLLEQGQGSRNYLDIGCAYGPSLAAAQENDLNPFGTDISEDAVQYVKNELHFPACCSAFPDMDSEKEFGISKFDSISMWYVIEHFKDLDSVLSKVSSIIRDGGIFAFATPSGEGVSAKSNPDNFYKISPTDHFSIWEPHRAQKILGRYGFEVVKIVSTGHHPERFPSIKDSNSDKDSMKWKLVDKYSRLMQLGDTVEIYCRKRK
ncbi:MAG: methyltransferase domain-containing protein [Treponema sp.]|nr:methyltransferase domain-containing protein [Treponema sp.]